jgi:hypothetical protein
MKRNGLISILVHPDYVRAEGPRVVYRHLLSLLSSLRSEKHIWIARPGEVNRWWRARHDMRLTRTGDNYRIEGPGSERARIAHARLHGEAIEYVIETGALARE